MISKKDTFSDAFIAFQEEGLLERLQEKYKARPYFQKAATLRKAVLASSFFLNLFSLATAFACVYGFIQLALPWPVLAAVFSLTFLTLLEALKRIAIPPLFKTWFQYNKLVAGQLLFIVLLSACSVVLSWQGAKDAVRLLSKPVQLTSLDQVRQPYLDQLGRLQEERRLIEKQTWQGKLVSDARKQLAVVQQQEAMLLQDLSEAVKAAEESNKDATLKHAEVTGLKAEHFAAAALVLDILLLFALAFLEYYDFRSLAEMSASGKPERPEKTMSADQFMTKQVTGFRPAIDNSTPGRTVVKGFDALHNAMHNCQHCGQGFLQKTTWQKFCSDACRGEFHAMKQGFRMKGQQQTAT